MGWDERQAALLAELGIRLWQVPPARREAPAVDACDRGAPTTATPASRQATPVAPERPAANDAPPASGTARSVGAADACASADTDDLADAALTARADAIAAMDWPALRDTVAGCQACALGCSRRHAVFGVGHPGADCMIVGEAPGEQEDQRGEPFVGKAGQLLDRMLAALGLSRELPAGEAEPGDAQRRVFIANVLKCRPPMNRNPLPAEIACCEPFLRRQVALVQPRVILALGRFAVQALLATDQPIGRLRGRLHAFEGRPVVVSYHPAYLLRNPADKAKAWDDLCLARAVLLGQDAASRTVS